MIVIIDYGGGNLLSVKNALDRLQAHAVISNDPDIISKADKVVFPGQGHFGACVTALKEQKLFDLIGEIALTKPFLGICVGMQLLFENSDEATEIAGLGIIKGTVKKYALAQKLPQMGWNQVQSQDSNYLDGQFFYFANSYHCIPKEKEMIFATSYYEEPFVSAIKKDQLLAVQFHPEKSGKSGMKLLEGFVRGELC